MGQAQTVLDRARLSDVRSDPYPYLVVEDALPADRYAALSASFPSLDIIEPNRAGVSNKRIDLLSSWGPAELPPEQVPPVWRGFIDDHIDSTFSRRVFDLFPSVTQQDSAGVRSVRVDDFGPDLAERLGLQDVVGEADIVTRVTLGVNTPVTQATSVRGPHVDNARKAFVGLYYLRADDDDSQGGNLAIFRKKSGASIDPWVQVADPSAVEQVAEIPYAANTLVLMLNTHDSFHGVTVRAPTPHVRRFVVVSGWFPGVDRTDSSRGSLARR